MKAKTRCTLVLRQRVPAELVIFQLMFWRGASQLLSAGSLHPQLIDLKRKMAEITDLSAEIIEKILTELDPKSLTRASEVCAKWKAIAEKNILRDRRLRRIRAKKCE